MSEIRFEKDVKMIKKEAENNIRLYKHSAKSLQNTSKLIGNIDTDTSSNDITPVSKTHRESLDSSFLFSNRERDKSSFNDSRLNISQLENKNHSIIIGKKVNVMSKGAPKLDISIKRRIENIKSRKASTERNDHLNKTFQDISFNFVDISDQESDKKYLIIFKTN